MGKRQKQIYDYIKDFIQENQYSPTMREIAKAVELKSVSTVHSHLEKMREKGYIDFVNSSPRTLRVMQ